MALAFPAGPTAGQQYTGPNGIVYQWDATAGVWLKVNSVQTVTSGATAATGAARIPTGNTAARPAATLAAGQFRYNSQIPQLEFSDGTAWLAVGGGTAATLPEAAAGTLNTVFSSPQTAVPKDASGMTGAAILPSGTLLQRPATPVAGMQRFNTDSGYEEVYTGATLGWQNLAYAVAPTTLVDVTIPTGATTLSPSYYCKNFTVTSGATLTVGSQGVIIYASGDVTINASTWTVVGVGGAPSITTNVNAFPESGFGLGAGVSDSTNGTSSNGYFPIAQLGGSSGGSGFLGANSLLVSSQAGGYAGGYIVILASGNVTLTGIVTMTCKGGNGGTVGAVAGGGGGGSGGCVIICSSKTITTPSTVTFDVSGGNGSNGVFNGAPGAGGGGGGGGWVILQSGVLVDSSTKNLAGGTAGSASGAGSNFPGGGGGSYAGKGGRAGSTAFLADSGAAGSFVTGYYPF
jgi:hypothetical protein